MKETLDNSTTSEAEGTVENTTQSTVTETTENLAEKESAVTTNVTSETVSEPSQEIESNAGVLTEPSEQAKIEAESQKTFINDLPDSLKEEKTLQNFKSVEDLAKSYVESRRLIGKKISEMTPEEMTKYNEGIGVPESPEGYDYGLEKGQEYNKEVLDWYGNVSHELGISQEKSKLMFDRYNEMQQEQIRLAEQQQIKAEEDQVSQLKEDWGPEFEKRLELAKRGIDRLGGDNLKEILNTSRLGNHPALAKAFAEVGAMISEDPSITGKSASKYGMSSEDAKSQVQKFESENRDAIHNRRHPDHKWAIEKRSQLYSLASSIK